MTNNDGTAITQAHYQTAEIQPIEIMQMYLTPEEFRGYLKGNVLKYTLRYGHKDATTKEASKIAQYSQWLKVVENGGKINPRE